MTFCMNFWIVCCYFCIIRQKIKKSMYANLQEPDSRMAKISRSMYLIVSVSLLTHTMSVTFSTLALGELSAGFIAIITSSILCYVLSSSHLTIYGISTLGILFLMMLEPYYTRPQIHNIVAMSGIIIILLEKIIHPIGSIFSCLPGRIHASMVFGIALVALTKLFPLAIQNLRAFFNLSSSDPLINPWSVIELTFEKFNVITLALTVLSIVLMFVLKERLAKIPFIGVLLILGIGINWSHYFLSYEDLCKVEKVDCNFYVLKLENIAIPHLKQIVSMLPAAVVMAAIVSFEQFLYLEEFERRGRRYGGEGNLGNVHRQTRILGLSNIIAGCCGGLPICINLFATYENYAFNKRFGFNGTKLVGLLQVGVSFLLYSFLKFAYNMIPLFILFTVVATPIIYFLKNIFQIHYRNTIFIIVLASINVLTHPIIGLIVASYLSVYQIAELLKAAPAEILMENVEIDGERKSSTLAKMVEKETNQHNQYISEFRTHIIEIEDDTPASLEGTSYVLYRLTGSISYLSFFSHVQELQNLIKTYIKPGKTSLIISFRYAQIIDDESLEELAKFVEEVRNMHIHVIFTGLYTKIMEKMQKVNYFSIMLQHDERSMYCIHPNQ